MPMSYRDSLYNFIRKVINKLVVYINTPREPAAIIAIAMYTVFIMYLTAVIDDVNRVWAVQVNDRIVALVSEPQVARKAIDDLVAEKMSETGREVTTNGHIRMVRIHPGDGTLMQGDRLKSALAEHIFFSANGAAVVVDGEVKLALRTRAEANALLERLKGAYRAPGCSVAFAEQVNIEDIRVDAGALVGLDEALSLVRKGTKELHAYQVREGDTLWDIASSAGMTVEQLISANPGMDPERLSIGQQINLAAVKPMINVLAVSRLSRVEEMPFEVQEKKDPGLYLGDRKVLQPGKPGKREVTYQITRRNGVEVNRQVLEQNVLEQPQARVVARGSKMLLASRSGGSGRLAWPTVGSVVSPYGKRGGRMHEGVDISGRTGDPVVASESGTVVSTGWNGGYGKVVEISHGDGVITRYAHLSRISVSVGQRVSRGQLIGRVGSTGRSSGPHLHFEVIVNGQQRNPSKYL